MGETPFKTFDLAPKIELDPARLNWPQRGEAQDEGYLGGNRRYFDIRGVSWGMAKEIILVERRLMERVARSADPIEEMAALEDEMNEVWDRTGDHPLWGFDLGVAGATVALSAAGCVTFTSCNGGAFNDGHHNEAYPLVAFYLRPRIAEIVVEAAKLASVGIHMNERELGSVQVYAPKITAMADFADAIFQARGSIRKAHRQSKSGG